MSKKIKYTLTVITVLIIGIAIFSYTVLANYNEISLSKGEEIMDKQRSWIEDNISLADTTSYETKRRIDSITRTELKILKTQDSLLKLEMNKNESQK
ncbi:MULTISPECIES: hypothetical protein [Tenacibaculum]|uniref:hypothetical protein n=1 Tax=Tenacibaculum TaxID=104267 RepID=UPI001F0B00B3|nr:MULTISPECIES: hypothetical protein [Tenacibaculum]MCH3881874.1 hypothetical protein [Tenacibaculum aquimarinum]MCH3885883.1 hypothetical protein [Tenacibaculum aquimarinum]MDO6598557.1 hypothetical protein [Tenacibaculum sp. 1_MG-2023]